MNPNPPSREEIEARLTALLLGELSAEEVRLLRWMILQDAELKKLHDELAATIILVREVQKAPAEASAEKAPAIKFSAERRAQLLAHFQTPRPQPKAPLFWLKPITVLKVPRLVEVLVVVAILAMLAAMLLPALSKAKSKAMRVSALNGERLKRIEAQGAQSGLEYRTWGADNSERKPAAATAPSGSASATVNFTVAPAPPAPIYLPSTPEATEHELAASEQTKNFGAFQGEVAGSFNSVDLIGVLERHDFAANPNAIYSARSDTDGDLRLAQNLGEEYRRSDGTGKPAIDPQTGLPVTPAESAAALVQDGKLLYEMGKLKEASSKFGEALKREPDNSAAYNYQNLNGPAQVARQSAQHQVDTQTRMASVEKPLALPLGGRAGVAAMDAAPGLPFQSDGRQGSVQPGDINGPSGGFGGGGNGTLALNEPSAYFAFQDQPQNLGDEYRAEAAVSGGVINNQAGTSAITPRSGQLGVAAELRGFYDDNHDMTRKPASKTATEKHGFALAEPAGNGSDAWQTPAESFGLANSTESATKSLSKSDQLVTGGLRSWRQTQTRADGDRTVVDSFDFQQGAAASTGETASNNSWEAPARKASGDQSSAARLVARDTSIYGDNVHSDLNTPTLSTEQLQRYHDMQLEQDREIKEMAAQVEELKKLDKARLREVLPNIVNDSKLADLLAKHHEAELAVAKQKDGQPSANQNLSRAQTQVDALDKQIDSRASGIFLALENQLKAKKSDFIALNQAVNQAWAEDESLAPKRQTFYDAKRAMEQLKTQHQLFAAKIEAEKLDQAIPRTSLVQIVDKAEPPKKQSLWQGMKGEYASSARIKVENDGADIVTGNSMPTSMLPYDPYFVQTTFEVMQSDAVLGRVVDSLKLDAEWSKKSNSEKLTKPEAVAMLKKRLEFKPVKNTKLIEIAATSSLPDEAGRIANAVAEAYRDYRLESRSQTGAKGIEVLEQQYLLESNRIQQLQAVVDELQPAATDSADKPLPKPSPAAPVPQPEVVCRQNNFSTFSLNVSDVSFKLAAASLERGQMPDAASIRSEEFINAFDYRDPEAATGQPLAFTAERARYPFAQNRDLLRFSVKTAAAGRAEGRALNLVLLLDNSGSMERADRVAIVREALRVLGTQLQPQDTVSVVTFARTARLWADGVRGNQAGETLARVGGITPEGGTNLEEAMKLAYETARRHYLANGMNRVVLLTDGAANLGDVNPADLKQKVEAQRQQGIALDCFGIGSQDFNDDLLEQLSRNGDGRYAFLNSTDDAAKEFAAKLAGALQVAASDVKVQVEFNPQRVISWRQIGYAKHQLKKEQFRDNTVDAAEIAAQEAGNALYTVETKADGVGPIATVRVRYKVPGTTDYRERSWDVPYEGNAPALDQSSAAMRLAATASAFSEWLAASPFAQEVSPDELLKTLSGVPQIYGADQRPKQLETMLREAKSLSGK